MEAYEQRTRDIIELFLSRRIGYPVCVSALNAALAAFIPTLTAEQIPRLRALLLANDDIVTNKLERRRSQP
jgi:hypothetical protein